MDDCNWNSQCYKHIRLRRQPGYTERKALGEPDRIRIGETGTAAEETSDNAAAAGEEQLYCIVNEATADSLNVSDMEGNTYTFEVKDSGLKLNDKIFVYYTGNLEDGSAQVLRIEIYEDGE